MCSLEAATNKTLCAFSNKLVSINNAVYQKYIYLSLSNVEEMTVSQRRFWLPGSVSFSEVNSTRVGNQKHIDLCPRGGVHIAC